MSDAPSLLDAARWAVDLLLGTYGWLVADIRDLPPTEDYKACASDLDKAMAAAEGGEVGGWRPIETAPKTERGPIELYRPAALTGLQDQRVTATYYDPSDGEGPVWMWPDGPEHDGWWERSDEFWPSGCHYQEVGETGQSGFTHWRPWTPPPQEQEPGDG